jgi:hypothetical protein
MSSRPENAITLLIISINSFLNNEIKITVDQNPPQTSLLFMGIHAVALTISEVLFNKKGEEGYERFLKEFIDEGAEDKCFSRIAVEIHAWRNTLVHGWLSLRGHNVEYEYDMQKGFETKDETLYINPRIYLDLYLLAFQKNGRIWQYLEKMTRDDLLQAQRIIQQKYLR